MTTEAPTPPADGAGGGGAPEAPAKHPGGRPSKMTPDRQERIAKAIAEGCYVETAAALEGIDRTTLHKWLRRGAQAIERAASVNDEAEDEPVPEADLPYVEFFHTVEKARAQADKRDLEHIDKAATAGEWQAAAWRLERRSPEKYGRRQAVELTGKGGGPVEVAARVEDVRSLPDQDLEQLVGRGPLP